MKVVLKTILIYLKVKERGFYSFINQLYVKLGEMMMKKCMIFMTLQIIFDQWLQFLQILFEETAGIL